MGITAGIDYTFQSEVSATQLVSALLSAGWGADEQRPFYILPPDRFGDMEWVALAESGEEGLVRWAETVSGNQVGVGIECVHINSGIGGSFIIFPGGKEISWTISINRPTIDSIRVVDFSACLAVAWEAIGKLSGGPIEIRCTQTG